MATDWPEARALALASILPAGVPRFVAMYLGNPVDSGVEITLTGYARVSHDDWSTVASPGSSVRSNASAIEFPTITELGFADYWAIFDIDAPGGILLRSGPLLDNLGQPVPITFTGLGDDARFNVGTITIRAVDI